MSTSRGNTTRNRPQKHQNRSVFKNDLHDSSHKTKFLNSLQIGGVCKRCKEIIEWKIKYKKYKMLTAPRKCVGCEQKVVKYAYHVLCNPCARERNVCAKCVKNEETIPEATSENKGINAFELLKTLTERKRRTILRFIKKQQADEQNLDTETMAGIQEILSKMDKASIDDDDSDFNFSSDDSECNENSDKE